MPASYDGDVEYGIPPGTPYVKVPVAVLDMFSDGALSEGALQVYIIGLSLQRPTPRAIMQELDLKPAAFQAYAAELRRAGLCR